VPIGISGLIFTLLRAQLGVAEVVGEHEQDIGPRLAPPGQRRRQQHSRPEQHREWSNQAAIYMNSFA
jgi:hypothetical protein